MCLYLMAMSDFIRVGTRFEFRLELAYRYPHTFFVILLGDFQNGFPRQTTIFHSRVFEVALHVYAVTSLDAKEPLRLKRLC
jgi:hypothetical protein